MPWLVPASRAALDTARWLTQKPTAPIIHSKWENLSVPEHATKSAPTSYLLMLSSRLFRAIMWARAFHMLMHGLSLAVTKPLMTTIISSVSELNLTMEHVNLV